MLALNNSSIKNKKKVSSNKEESKLEPADTEIQDLENIKKEDEFKVKVLSMKKNHWIYEDQMKEIFESNEKNFEKKLEIIDNQLNLQTNNIQERIKERRTSFYISGFYPYEQI